MPRLFPYSESYNAPVYSETALLHSCHHHCHPPAQTDTPLQDLSPRYSGGGCWPCSPRAVKHWQPRCSHGFSVEAGCQLRLPCLSVPGCLPGGRWWDGNSPNRLFLLHFWIPNTFGCVAMTNVMGLIFCSFLLLAARVLMLVLCPSTVLWTTLCSTQPLLLWQEWTTGSWKEYPVLAEPGGRRHARPAPGFYKGAVALAAACQGWLRGHGIATCMAGTKPGVPWGCTGGAGAVLAKPGETTYSKEAAPSCQCCPALCFPLSKSHQGQIPLKTSNLWLLWVSQTAWMERKETCRRQGQKVWTPGKRPTEQRAHCASYLHCPIPSSSEEKWCFCIHLRPCVTMLRDAVQE